MTFLYNYWQQVCWNRIVKCCRYCWCKYREK